MKTLGGLAISSHQFLLLWRITVSHPVGHISSHLLSPCNHTPSHSHRQKKQIHNSSLRDNLDPSCPSLALFCPRNKRNQHNYLYRVITLDLALEIKTWTNKQTQTNAIVMDLTLWGRILSAIFLLLALRMGEKERKKERGKACYYGDW